MLAVHKEATAKSVDAGSATPLVLQGPIPRLFPEEVKGSPPNLANPDPAEFTVIFIEAATCTTHPTLVYVADPEAGVIV